MITRTTSLFECSYEWKNSLRITTYFTRRKFVHSNDKLKFVQYNKWQENAWENHIGYQFFQSQNQKPPIGDQSYLFMHILNMICNGQMRSFLWMIWDSEGATSLSQWYSYWWMTIVCIWVMPYENDILNNRLSINLGPCHISSQTQSP